jgi:PKD repeat protein
MRSFLLLAFLAVFTSQVAQSQGLEGIVVERYYITDAADEANSIAQGAISPLPVGSVTYRVYVDMAAGYKYSQVYGSETHNMLVNTTTSFYNDPNFGVAVNPGTTSLNLTRRHTTMIDSWFTAGGTCVGKVGVMEQEDTDGTIGNQQNILANNAGGCYGLPINGTNAQDGMLPSTAATYVAPNTLGLGNALDVLDQTFGNSIFIDNGTIVPLGGVVGPTASNRVLIAQFTTSGTLSFQFNVQLINIGTGAAENYVASNPVGDELTHPTLTFISGQAPVVAITSPSNNASVAVGNAITISANATDNGGIVTRVEFYVDGVLLSTDNTAPFSANYVPTPGAHILTAIAFDNDCQVTNSTAVNITAQSNTPPTVTVSAPASAIAGTTVTLTAVANDSDGTIAQVEFFVNNISVGIDNSFPYSVDYLTTLGAGQIVRAVATDNQGATANSNNVVMNVVANVPPTVAITSPANGALFVAPESVTINATASDIDGTVAQVEFFVDGVSIGIDNSSPFSATWISVEGEHILRATATDNLGASTNSSIISITVADPNALPYYIDDVFVDCSSDLVCVPIGVSVAAPVSGIIGYDFEINYDASQLEPTGVFEVFDNLINPEYVSISFSNDIPGTISLSVSLNGSAPAETTFNGFGDLLCISFVNGTEVNGSTEVSFGSIQESYPSEVTSQAGSEGTVTSIIATDYNSQILFWANSSPLSYNEQNPNEYLITNIFGVNEEGTISSPVQPNIDGEFTYDFSNGLSIQVERDIQASVAVQPIVNAADAVIAKTIVADAAYSPSVFQMIAMDVNLDGVVSAGDISQINQRATSAISEYQQAWNYVNGISNGELSKDWIFVKESDLENAAYQISSSFPADDMMGYSRLRVPSVPFILDLSISDFDQNNCPIVNEEGMLAIMLGDVDGSYANYQADGLLRGAALFQNDTLLYDLSELQYSNDGTDYFIEFPVALQGEATDINAVDFWMNFDLNKLAFESATISVANAEVFAHFNEVSQVLRVTASGDDINSFFITGEEVMKLRFTLVDPCEVITSIDFAPMEVLFNGVMSNALLNEAPDVTSAIIEVEAQSVYCANDEIAFSLEGEYYGQEYTTNEWSFGNGQESILPIGLVEYASGGDFVVNLTALTAAGCVSFLSTPISIENAPVVSFTATVAGDLSAEFQNNSTIATGTIVSYEWEFGDGNGSTEENPDHAYAAMGLFDVTLTATSDLGCTSSVTQTVDVVNSVFDIENSGIRIFPNPTNGIITIQAQDNFKCRVLDAAGRVVFDNIIITNGLKSLVDLSVLAPGNYHLILTNSMKNYSTQIVVIP